PEYIWLESIAVTRVRKSVRMDSPKIIDARVVALCAESRPKKIAGKNQPGFLVFDRLSAMRIAFVERLPERADKHIIPIGFQLAKNLLEALEKIGSADFIAHVERPGENRRDPGSCAVQPVRFHSGPEGLVIILLFGVLFGPILVRAKIEFQGPGSLHSRIRADAGDGQQAEFIHAGSESYR